MFNTIRYYFRLRSNRMALSPVKRLFSLCFGNPRSRIFGQNKTPVSVTADTFRPSETGVLSYISRFDTGRFKKA